jgi:hypothetical protein
MNDLCPVTKKGCGRPAKRKRSIVEHFEVPIAALYPRDTVRGIFPSEPPLAPEEKKKRPAWDPWMSNVVNWKYLVREQDFPVVKVNMVKKHNDTTILSNCTKKMDIDFLRSLNYSSIRRPPGSQFS